MNGKRSGIICFLIWFSNETVFGTSFFIIYSLQSIMEEFSIVLYVNENL